MLSPASREESPSWMLFVCNLARRNLFRAAEPFAFHHLFPESVSLERIERHIFFLPFNLCVVTFRWTYHVAADDHI